MNEDGWIYILKGWDRLYVHKSGPRSDPPWPFVKNETALLDDPDYLTLTALERAWLHGIWMLAGRLGQGRVKATVGYLKGQLGVRKGSLEPLIQAGWIEVRASKAQALSKAKAKAEVKDAPEVLREEEETARATGQPQPVNDNTQTAIEALLIACGSANSEAARSRLTVLMVNGATERHYAWAKQRVQTARGVKNPAGYAIGIIRRELEKEEHG